MARFGEVLAELRQDRSLTQEQLAKILFVSKGTISNYENGIHFPDIEKLLALADYFGVTTDFLLGRVTANISPDVLDEAIFPGVTVGTFINDIHKLSPDRKKALQVITRDMHLSMLLNQYSIRLKHMKVLMNLKMNLSQLSLQHFV